MKLEYDWTYVLSVDYRYKQEKTRMESLLYDLDIEIGMDASFFIDGDGEQLPRSCYSQISPPPPRTWTDGPASYAHFSAFKKMLQSSKDKGRKNVLIVEDDLVLTPDFDEVASAALQQLPDDWDIFYFGANHSGHRTADVSPNILRCYGSACTHMIVFRDSVFDAVLGLPADRTIDWNIANRLHHTHKCYACWPNVAVQRPGYSLLWKQKADYTELFKSKGEQILIS